MNFYKRFFVSTKAKKLIAFSLIAILLLACSLPFQLTGQPASIPTRVAAIPTQIASLPTKVASLSTQLTTIAAAPKSLLKPPVPAFNHIIVILFENRTYYDVVGSQDMPYFNQLAGQNVLLTQSYAVTHPSLPNYIALISGDTYGITSDCTDCFINQTNLADSIEKSGKTWKTYQESIPSPCFVGNSGDYAQKHDPFIYFDDIRKDTARCDRSVVPIDKLNQDLSNLTLPNFALIVPNLCNSGHDCNGTVIDAWLKQMINQLHTSGALGDNYLIAITFDEARGESSSCCGLGKSAGGHVATVLISPQAKSGYQDSTPYSHYSLLKTIETAWSLPLLGFSANSATNVITAPWK